MQNRALSGNATAAFASVAEIVGVLPEKLQSMTLIQSPIGRGGDDRPGHHAGKGMSGKTFKDDISQNRKDDCCRPSGKLHAEPVKETNCDRYRKIGPKWPGNGEDQDDDKECAPQARRTNNGRQFAKREWQQAVGHVIFLHLTPFRLR